MTGEHTLAETQLKSLPSVNLLRLMEFKKLSIHDFKTHDHYDKVKSK